MMLKVLHAGLLPRALLGLLLWQASAYGEADAVYRWTDSDGNTHFGDRHSLEEQGETGFVAVAPDIKPVARELLDTYLKGAWRHTLKDQPEFEYEELRFSGQQRVKGRLLLGTEALMQLEGNWQWEAGWLVLALNTPHEVRGERELKIAVTDLTEYTMTMVHTDGRVEYWYRFKSF